MTCTVVLLLFYFGERFSDRRAAIKTLWVRALRSIPEPCRSEPVTVHWLRNSLHRGTQRTRRKLATSSNLKALSASQGGMTISKFHRQLSSHSFNVCYRLSALPSTLHILSLITLAIVLWIGIIVISILKIRNFSLERLSCSRRHC